MLKRNHIKAEELLCLLFKLLICGLMPHHRVYRCKLHTKMKKKTLNAENKKNGGSRSSITSIFMSDKFEFTSQEQKTKDLLCSRG